MIITMITVVLVCIGIILHFLNKHFYADLDTIGAALVVFGSFGLIICVCTIIGIQATSDYKVKQLEVEYTSLVEQKKILDSQYEDISKAEVINRIGEWNKKVEVYKYWADSPWTNWFHSKKVLNSIQCISFSIEGGTTK
ncbi:MAG: hypothetical protein J6U54_07590 [Clostridiales bacterium]|nr:hypothetical protein [Clostridiales bacterium]